MCSDRKSCMEPAKLGDNYKGFIYAKQKIYSVISQLQYFGVINLCFKFCI